MRAQSPLAAVKRRRRISLTSLIDVIFLLLLFFMLSSTFTRFADLPFIAAAEGATPMEGPPPVFLRVLPDRLILDTAEVLPADLPRVLTAKGAALVLVSPDPAATAQRLVDALAATGGLPDITLRLLGG